MVGKLVVAEESSLVLVVDFDLESFAVWLVADSG